MSSYGKKEYQSLIDATVALTSFSEKPAGAVSPKEGQNLHRDHLTLEDGLEYFFLGNGLIQVAVQHASKSGSGTALGLLIMHPEHFTRKSSTLLYHPEAGIERTMMTVIVNEKLHYPSPATVEVHWEYPNEIPTVVATWRAGRCTVREELWCPTGVAALVRSVAVTNNGRTPVRAQARTMLYPNVMLFDEQFAHEEKQTLEARGYTRLYLSSLEKGRAHDRWVTVDLDPLSKGAESQATFFYMLEGKRGHLSRQQLASLRKKTSEFWKATSRFEGHKILDHLFRASKNGLCASISSSGKMDASIWQYNQEWVRDECVVVIALVMSGQEKIAKRLLERMMEKMVNEHGVTLESSRWRGYDLYELDQNGELLYTHWMYWRWTNDDSLIRRYWKKIVAVAEFPLRSEFWDSKTGLLGNTREYWERSAPFGVREGYELTYQLWPSIGLQKAAEIASALKKPSLAFRWSEAAEKIRHSMLSSPTHALIDGGRFIKRRLVKGEVQTVFVPPDRSAMPPGVPLATEENCYCEPDTQEVLPIALEFVSPESGLARNTMMEIEKLWNQRWDFGGYSRYNVASEPDSPGPWPFATMFVARAYLEMRDHEKAWRALRWLYNLPGGKAGTWLEVYCSRPVPPLPPLGVPPWNWAEIMVFLVHHLLGVRPTEKELVIRPKLLAGLREVRAEVRVHGKRISLLIRRGRKKEARVGGRRIKLEKRTLKIRYPSEDVKIAMTV